MTSTVTEAQRKRYARRVWAGHNIGAVMTPETAHAPLRAHGPAEQGENWYYGAAEWGGRRNPADVLFQAKKRERAQR